MRLCCATSIRALAAALTLLTSGLSGALAQDAEVPPAAEMPAAAEAPAAEAPAAPPAASAIPKPAAEKKPAKKTAKKAVSCDGLFEAACKEAEPNCSWSGGLMKADGTPPKGECVKVSKSADKGTKTSCPTMFEALCKETAGCEWTVGQPGADGKMPPGACAFTGKKKSAAAVKKPAPTPAAAPKEPAPDAFTDQQAQ